MSEPDAHSRTQLRRAVASSYLGSVIEYYDFLLYATASAVVFGKVFFSTLDPLVGTVASFGTLATGYLARPLGGVIFGHFGDRVGRKKALVTTMTLMGVVSVLIGLLPTYAQIGVWAPILLVLLRVLQGVAVGGEWGGAVLMSAEHARTRRGLWASFTSAGAPSGMVVSTLALAGAAAISGEQGFLTWGWRIPFLLSAVLLGIGLFVRMRVEETPVFKTAARPTRPPLLAVLRERPGTLALAVGIGFGAFIAQGVLTVFVIAYAVQAGFTRQTVLNALTVSSVVAAVGVLVFASFSDRVGRRPVMIVGAIGMGIWGFLLFPMVDSGSTALLVVAVVVGQGLMHACWFAPLAALYAEMFATGSRYTGASLGYQIAGIGAGVGPVVFAALLRGTGSALVISVVIAVFCMVSIVCVLATRETNRTSLTEEATDGAEVPARTG